MRVFALVSALATLVTAVTGAAARVDTGYGLEIGREDVESYVALSTAPPDPEIVTRSGVILVSDTNDKRLGYISKNLQKNGLLINDPVFANALVVTFTMARTSTGHSTKLYLTATVCFDPSHYVGLLFSPSLTLRT